MAGQRRSRRLCPRGKITGTHFTEDWVGHRAGLEDTDIFAARGCDVRNIQPVMNG